MLVSYFSTAQHFPISNCDVPTDDKGTVAIGSFGLRGSTTYDNAASAVEAALNIIVHLQNVGLNASIGITSGKAYCGVVGKSIIDHTFYVN